VELFIERKHLEDFCIIIIIMEPFTYRQLCRLPIKNPSLLCGFRKCALVH
jgi:hypothetical protein